VGTQNDDKISIYIRNIRKGIVVCDFVCTLLFAWETHTMKDSCGRGAY
jgi:hypothetical protein